jgi:two-component system OmpR family sensor kinase
MKLTIFGRTFLLILAALVVAHAAGFALLITRPPLHNAPLRLSEIARQLGGSEAAFEPFGLGELRHPEGRRPAFGDGPRMTHGFPASMRREWTVHDAITAPLPPKDYDKELSERLATLLALRLGVERSRVVVYVSGPVHGRPGFEDAEFAEGFVAAWQRDSKVWRVMESSVEGFPNAFQRQAMWLLAIGLVVMLPVAWLFARALAAPIRRFSEGARRLGTDPHAPALERSGPAEMLTAIDSFNAMQGRVTRLLQERAHMIGAIAHDLRTPLMRLAFRLDDLESPLKEKVEADIGEMRAMISAALDFLRDQAAGSSRERVDFRLLVESVVDDQSDVGHDVTLAGGEPVTLVGDPLALRRMVVNLVDNALKYGERARLKLRTSGGQCVLELDDDGPGIPEALQSRVFEPFFRTESSRNRDTGGIGLGLTTVRAIVLDHGGDIELRNRKEGGLRVVVSLPLPGQ